MRIEYWWLWWYNLHKNIGGYITVNKCKECRYFTPNPNNEDGKCKKDEFQKGGNADCCDEFKKKLDDKKLYVLEFSRAKKIESDISKNFSGLKKEVFDELQANECIAQDGHIVLRNIREKYPDIF